MVELVAGELMAKQLGGGIQKPCWLLLSPWEDLGSRVSLQHQASSLLSFLALFRGLAGSCSPAETPH